MDSAVLEDTTMADPTMIDTTMEDLFGDAGDGLNVALPPAPLPAATVLRIAEMQSRGCCTKLAWSSTGSIAQISADGTKVLFRSILRDGQAAGWTVSEASKHPIEASEGRKFVHAQFSGIGIDLAVVDNLGTTHLFTLTGALGRMVPASGDLSRTAAVKSELDAVVGLHWLQMFPTEFKSPCFDPALKHGEKWEFSMKQRDQKRAHHPQEGRNAIFHVSRSSELTLLYQNEGQGWQSTSVMLDVVRSSDELMSHADIGEDGDDLLVVTHDYSSRLRLYRITLNWNGTQHIRAPNQTYTLVAPTLEVHHLTALDHVHAEHVESAKLTHLRLLPTPPDAAQPSPAFPLVVGIFAHAPLPSEASQNEGSFSVVVRWQVESVTPTLHESFKKLKPSTNLTATRNSSAILIRQADIMMNKIILTFDSQIFDTVLAFAATDGSVDFRDRTSMDSLHFSQDTNIVSGLAQTGFVYVAGEHHVLAVMNSDGAAIILMRPDGKLTANPMTFGPGWQEDDGIGDNRASISAAEACVARQFAFLCYTNASNDEALALLPFDVPPKVSSTVIRHIYKIMNRTPDFSLAEPHRQQMFVLKDPLVPRAMSAALVLGTNSISGERDSRAQLAFALLNLRSISMAMAQTLIRQNHRDTQVEVFTSMCGFIRWMTNFTVHILDTLSTIKREIKEKGITAKEAFQQLNSRNGDPVIYVLLCSFTRTLLRFAVMWTGKYFQIVQGAVLPRVRTIAERQDLTSVLELATKTPFKHPELDKMMLEFDGAVRDAWNKSNLGSERRSEIEAGMMCDGDIPVELEPAINNLMDTILPKLEETMEMSKLHFWHIERLGLRNSKPQSGQQYDIHRKVPLPKGTPLRLCRRCGSVMEDLPPDKVREMPSWLAHAQRHCICMNFWIPA